MAGENAGLTIQLNTIFAKQSNCYCCAISFFFLDFPYGDISPHQWLSKHRPRWESLCFRTSWCSNRWSKSPSNHAILWGREVDTTWLCTRCHGSLRHLVLWTETQLSKVKSFEETAQRWRGLNASNDSTQIFRRLFLGQKKWGPLRGLDTMVGCIYYSWTQKHKKPSAIIWKMSSGVKFFGICLREDTESMRIEDAGVYKLCWCHVGSQSDCSRLEDFNVEAGRISSQISLLQGHWGG